MSFRTYIGNSFIGFGRKFARKSGETEIAVTISEHSIDARMVDVDSESMAWDENLYRHGNVFVQGYANPVKPVVNHHKDLDTPDTVELEESDVADSADVTTDASVGGENHVELISSPRYRDYMRQDLISQLLNPREQWRLLAYGIIALGGIMLVNFVVTLSAAGVL